MKEKESNLNKIEIFYVTPKNQLWGIFKDGTKKCVIYRVKNETNLNEFLSNKKLISYNDSKLFKKGLSFISSIENVKLAIKNKTFTIKILNKKALIKDIGYKQKPLYFFQNYLLKNKSPLRYPGGKTRACKVIHKILSDHFALKTFKTIISPFFGGGSFEFFLANKYNYNIIANDIYYYLSNFWYICKTNQKELVELLSTAPKIDKEAFVDYKKKLKSTDNKILQAYYFFILNRCSFNGSIDSGGFSKLAAEGRFTKSSINLISSLNLSNFNISNCDFEPFLNTIKKENSLIFLDPPYFSNKVSKLYGDSGYLHTHFDHLRLFDIISSEHNWILTYDNSLFIKDLYKDFIQIEVSWSYGMTTTKKKELIIIGKNSKKAE
jgi:DNA adenine methylase